MDALPCLPLSSLDGRLACLNLSSSVLLEVLIRMVCAVMTNIVFLLEPHVAIDLVTLCFVWI
eukprot:COSAG04_NODE_864_length_9792_cov_22.506035_12_plen_62_part_00